MDGLDSTDERLQELLTRWLQSIDDGRPLDIEELADGDPEIASQLMTLIERGDSIERALGALGGAPAPSTRSRRSVGHFRLLSHIGTGASGDVYRAHDATLDRIVAVKILKPGVADSGKARRRFDREARAAASLEHPNIVPIHAVGRDHECAWIAMKYLSGPSLAAVGRRSTIEIARIGADIAGALAFAHGEGIAHCDVKPSNIVLDGDRPVLVDFGLAVVAGDLSASRAGAVVGTILYMSPEQVLGRPIGPPVDVWGLAATLYECVANRPPFPGDDPATVLRTILDRDPPRLDIRTQADSDMDVVLARALEKDPRTRFADAAAFGAELDRIARGEAILSRRTNPLVRLVRRARRYPRTAVAIMTVAAIIAVSLAVAVAAERKASRRLEDGFAAVEIAVKAERFAVARERLREIEREAPKDRRVEDLRGRINAVEALQSLLIELGTAYDILSQQEIRDRLAIARSGGPETLSAPATRHAFALAAFFLGEHAESCRIIADARSAGLGSRALDIIDSAASGRAIVDADLLSRDNESADELLYAAIGRRLVGRPLEESRQEIERALLLEPSHRLARQYLGRVLHIAGNFDAAFEVFRGIVVDGRHPGDVLVFMATELVAMNRPSEAAARLDEVAAEDRADRWTEIRSRVYWQMGDRDSAFALLEGVKKRRPNAPTIRLLIGQFLLLSGRLDAAKTEIEASLELGPSVEGKIRGRYYLSAIETSRAVAGIRAGTAEDDVGEDLEEILRQLVGLSKASPPPQIASAILLLMAQIEELVGRPTESWLHTRQSVEVSPQNPESILVFARKAVEGILLRESGDDPGAFIAVYGPIDQLAAEAERVLERGLIDGKLAGISVMSPTDAAEVEFDRAVLAWNQGDMSRFEDARARFNGATPELPDHAARGAALESLAQRKRN